MEQIKRVEGIDLDDALRELDKARPVSRGTRCGAWTSAPTRFTIPDAENMTFSLTDPFKPTGQASPCCPHRWPALLPISHAAQACILCLGVKRKASRLTGRRPCVNSEH